MEGVCHGASGEWIPEVTPIMSQTIQGYGIDNRVAKCACYELYTQI